MDLPQDILTRPASEAACLIALGFLAQARRGAEQLARGDGPDDLHDFRVAVRRLRSTLRAYERELRGTIKKKHRRALRKVQASTGGGRDFEVAAAWIAERIPEASAAEQEGEAWLAGSFEARHAAAMRDVRAGALAAFARIAHILDKRLGKRLRKGPPASVADFAAPEASTRGTSATPGLFADMLLRALREHMDDVVLHLAHLKSIDDVEEAHAARICVKRVRYLVEPLDGVLPGAKAFGVQCKALQDVLGDLNDARVLEAELSQLEAPSGSEGERVRPGLDALRHDVHARREHLYAILISEWIRDLAAPMRALINQMVFTCSTAGVAPIEIERKYLLRALPGSMPGAVTGTIRQGWLPGTHPRERLRHRTSAEEGSVWRRTMKAGRGLERVEVEDALPEAVFEALWPLTAGCRVHKRRHVVPADARRWEIDEFLDRDGLYLAEIELASPDEEVRVPDWLAPLIVREVTEEDGFTNLELAL